MYGQWHPFAARQKDGWVSLGICGVTRPALRTELVYALGVLLRWAGAGAQRLVMYAPGLSSPSATAQVAPACQVSHLFPLGGLQSGCERGPPLEEPVAAPQAKCLCLWPVRPHPLHVSRAGFSVPPCLIPPCRDRALQPSVQMSASSLVGVLVAGCVFCAYQYAHERYARSCWGLGLGSSGMCLRFIPVTSQT